MYVPNSFNMSIPSIGIGSGLDNQSIVPIFGATYTPNEVNYVEFFNKCGDGMKFVLTYYGHMDMFNDNLRLMSTMASFSCVKGHGGKFATRRTVDGLLMDYLEASFLNDPSYHVNMITNPSLSSRRLYPIEIKTQDHKARYSSQI